jgi:hypothetical protein
MIRWAAPLLLCNCANLIGITDERDLEVSALTVSVGTLSPPFDPAITHYELSVGYPDPVIEVHAETNDPGATIEVAGFEVAGGTGVAEVSVGDTTVEVIARTPSGVEAKYEIAVHRADLIIAFAAPRQVPVQMAGMIDRVALADLDGNGTPDLVPMSGVGDAGLMTNDGGAHFMFRGQLPYGGIRQIAMRDFEPQDGKPDVLLMNGGFQLLRGLGNAQFDAGFGCGAPPSPIAFTMFQFDGDGRQDLAFVDQQGRLSPMLSPTAPGTCFQAMPAIEQQVSPTALTQVVAGPIDNMPGDDLATLDPMSGRIFIHRNVNGQGLTIEQLELGAGAQASEVAVADVDGDVRAEVIWIDRTTEDVVVQQHPGPRGASYHVPGNPRSLTITDVDGDGFADIVVLDNMGITVLHYEGGGTFSQKHIGMQLPGVSRIAMADLDGDGRSDLVTANFTSTLSVFLGETP